MYALSKRKFLINFCKISLFFFLPNFYYIKNNTNLLKLKNNKKFIWYLNEND
jgi:hypothetical protein